MTDKKPFKTKLTADFMTQISDIARKNSNSHDGGYTAPAKVIVECILGTALEDAAKNYCVSTTEWSLRKGQLEKITDALQSIGYAVDVAEARFGLFSITIRWVNKDE